MKQELQKTKEGSQNESNFIESHAESVSKMPPAFRLESSPIQTKKDQQELDFSDDFQWGAGSVCVAPSAVDFRTQVPITRAGFILQLLKADAGWIGDWRLEGKSAEEVMQAGIAFSNGDRPYAAITRAEAAAMMVRFAGLSETAYECDVVYFADVYPAWHAGWVFDSAHIARMYGFFQGNPHR